MYSVHDYGEMMADHVRMAAYREALRRTVRPGSVVVDLGAGAGVMAWIACKLGAKKVYAIEPSDVIEVAREIARANGFADRIEFLHQYSSSVRLPESADVLVSDLRGVLPPHRGHLETIADARVRFLKPAGALIPQRDTLWAAVIEAPGPYGLHLGPWEDGDLDLSAWRRLVANTWSKQRFDAAQLLSEAAEWACIDYRTVECTAVFGKLDVRATRAGNAHGLVVWFDANLIEDVGFSTAPGGPVTVYGQGFFPFLKAIQVEQGDTFEATIRADLAGGKYIWSWNTVIRAPSGAANADFHQSAFHGDPLSPDRLRKRADSFVPKLNEDGAVDRLIIEQFGTGRSLHEIAVDIASRFPARFSNWQSALERVACLSGTYSE
jgi:protein arginine N-methyltransferase 1